MFVSPGQRLIFDILTMVITADTKEQLEAGYGCPFAPCL